MGRLRSFPLLCSLTLAACSGGRAAATSSSTGGEAMGGASSSASSGAASSTSSSSASTSGSHASSSSGASSSGGSTGGGGAGGSTGTAAGTIVPLYSYPTDASWSAVTAAKKAHPTVPVWAIINPNSGPGTSADPAFQTGIAALGAAKIVVLGYVATTYAKKPLDTVHAEVDAYGSFYTGLDGIMFDEMSNTPGDEAYYQGLDTYVRGSGYTVTVGNPGADVPASFIGALDTLFVYESEGLPDVGNFPAYYASQPRSDFGLIAYGVAALDTAFVASAGQHVGFIYLTDDTLPNPYDTLPGYFDGLLAALE